MSLTPSDSAQKLDLSFGAFSEIFNLPGNYCHLYPEQVDYPASASPNSVFPWFLKSSLCNPPTSSHSTLSALRILAKLQAYLATCSHGLSLAHLMRRATALKVLETLESD